MESKIQQLKLLLGEITDLLYAQSVLSWDQQTYMPSGGAEGRGEILATLARLEHTRWTAPELGRLLDELEPAAQNWDPDSDDACLVRVARREFTKRTRVPNSFVGEFARATALGQEDWVRARQASDFSIFQSALEHVVDLRRQYASFFAPYTHIYDALLDDFEPGMKTAEVQTLFEELRGEQVSLVKAIADRPQLDTSFLGLNYDEAAQWTFGVDVISRFGFDWQHGRLDKSAHPFTNSLGFGDVRITTRPILNQLGSAMFGTMHECGHALYELGLAPELARTPLAAGASMAVHESQSRMWENLVGRSLPFWKFFYPRLQKTFPAQLGKVGLEKFYAGINRVQPSYIRTEADEATYNLHIMLRMELEIALMEGSLAVKDLPGAWNQRMQNYLGVTPPDTARGVLQDIHWSIGSIGYFPTYALGNLVSVQLWEKVRADIPDLDAQMEQGQFAELLGWLRSHIHRHGAKFEPQTLVKKVTGSPINAKPYLRYLKSKYSSIYGL